MTSIHSIQRPVGTRDVPEEDYLALRELQDTLQSFLRLNGYHLIDTPILEKTNLFLRKSGGELATKMYSFIEPGGHSVSLRPELTASAIRAHLERKNSTYLPYRCQYAGPVFRYNANGGDANVQFTQVGAEFIGSGSTLADAEILALACRSIQKIGINPLTLVIGHVGVLGKLLAGYGISERARAFIFSKMKSLGKSDGAKDKALQEAIEIGLLRPTSALLAQEDTRLNENKINNELLKLLTENSDNVFVGRRSPEEVLSRLSRKAQGQDDPRQLEDALEFAARLARIRAEPKDAFDKASELINVFGLDQSSLAECEELVDAFTTHALAGINLVIDFSLVRSIAYYTGMVFEIECSEEMGEISLCGGGRYNGLVRALGGPDTPALGFACTLEILMQSIGRPTSRKTTKPAGVLIMALTKKAFGQAIHCAEQWRNRGVPAEIDLEGRSLNTNLAYARNQGLAAVITVKPDGHEQQHPTIS